MNPPVDGILQLVLNGEVAAAAHAHVLTHARTDFKCQVTTAESQAASVMQEPADIWERRVAKAN